MTSQESWDAHVRSALLVAYDTGMQPTRRVPARLVVSSSTIVPERDWSTTLSWRTRWLEQLTAAADEAEAWAVVGINGHGDARLFDTSAEGLFRCAGWAVEVHLVTAP